MKRCDPLGCLFRSAVFNALISALDKGIESTLSKFADDTKLSSVVGTPEAWYLFQGHLDKLQKLPMGSHEV